MTTWTWIIFESREDQSCKPHAVPDVLRDVIADLVARHGSGTAEARDEVVARTRTIDAPGMVYATRPFEYFEVDGLDVGVPCEDVAHVLGLLEACPPRESAAGDWYKVVDWIGCTCLTAAMRDDLLAQMCARLPEAELKSCAFYAEHAPPSLVLRQANAVAHGVDVDDVPNLGANKQDRFVVKERGQA